MRILTIFMFFVFVCCCTVGVGLSPMVIAIWDDVLQVLGQIAFVGCLYLAASFFRSVCLFLLGIKRSQD